MSKTLEELKIKQKELFLDFHQNLYKTVLAKECDKGSRFVPIICTDNGKKVVLEKNTYYIQVMVKTPDNRAILEDTVVINDDGTLTLELTESMLCCPGKAIVSIIFYDIEQSGKKEIETTKRLTTMNFNLIIEPNPYCKNRIIDSDEFDALTKLMEEAKRHYDYVIEESKEYAEKAKEKSDEVEKYANLSRSYAVGDTDPKVRQDEETDNAKYYYEQSGILEKNAENSSNNANEQAEKAENSAKTAIEKASGAETSSIEAESFAHGGTNTRDNEETDNAKYYYERSHNNNEISKEYLTKVEKAGNDAVEAIKNALDIDAPNFYVDLSTGHLMYEGGRFVFNINHKGHLEWGLTI